MKDGRDVFTMNKVAGVIVKRAIHNVTRAQQNFDELHPETRNSGAILEDFKIMEALKIIDSATAVSMEDGIHHAWFKDVLKKLEQLN